MFRSGNLILVLLKSHSLDLYHVDSHEQTTLALPPDVVDNLEVIDVDKLYGAIAEWSKVRTYQNTDLVILLHPSVCFEQKLADSDKLAWDTQTLQFLDSVPFEDVLSHLYHPLDGRLIIATNNTLVTAISHGFALHGYNTRSVVPCSLAGLDSFVDPVKLKSLLGKLSNLAKESFILEPSPPTNKPTVAKPASSAKSQLPILLGVFGLLLAVLVIMVVLR